MAQRQTISTLEAETSTISVPLEAQRRWHRALRACYGVLAASGVAALIKAALAGWSNEYSLLIICAGWGGMSLVFPGLQPSFTVMDAHRYRWSKIRLRWWMFYGGGVLLAFAGEARVGEARWPGVLEPELIAVAGGIVALWLLLAQKGGEP